MACSISAPLGGRVLLKLIGLVGKIKTGKTTIASVLSHEFEYDILSFGEKLKEISSKLWDIPIENFYDQNLKTVIDPRWGKSPRWFLQHFGTEVVRRLHPMTWIYHVEREVQKRVETPGYGGLKICVEDVRFLNEAQFIKRYGGSLWRVKRDIDISEYYFNHASESEQDLIEADTTIINDGSIPELEAKVRALMHGEN